METIDDIETLATFLGNHIQEVDREEWFALLFDLTIQGLKEDLDPNRSAMRRLRPILTRFGAEISFTLDRNARVQLAVLLMPASSKGHL